MRAAAVDALVVSHLPNIRYLTGFAGSAGLVVLTPGTCVLVVDFRYQTVARRLVQSTPRAGGNVTVVVPAKSYDETLADVLRETGARRIGVEAAWMSVSRFNRLSSALAGSAPTPLRSPDGCPALVATERIIEAERVVKDEVELADIEGGRPAAGRGGGRGRSVWLSRAARSSTSPPTSTRCCAGRVSSARPSRRSSLPGRIAPCRTRGPARGRSGRVTGWCWTSGGSTTDTAWISRGRFSWATRALISPFVRRGGRGPAAGDCGGPAGSDGKHGRRRGSGRARPIWVRRGVRARDRARARARSARGAEDRRGPSPGQPDPVLQPGMVFTIEPGAYVAGIGGVRIEDDVLVTDEGCLVLTANGG